VRLGVALALLAAAAVARDKPKDLLEQLSAEAARPQGEAFRALFTKDCFAKLRGAETQQLLRDLGGRLAGASFLGAEEEGDEAVLSFRTRDDRGTTRDLLLRREDGQWRVAAPRSYAVSGDALAARCGRKAPRLTLRMRTDNGAYGASAFSFTHVTSDPEQCKNRMDIWYCHNGDLHAASASVIADLGKGSLSKVKAIPAGAEWRDSVAAEKGHAYVLHCRHADRMDFYVKLVVREVKADRVELEWSLLSDGLGCPPDIHAPQPLVSNDGADGCDGLCGRSAAR